MAPRNEYEIKCPRCGFKAKCTLQKGETMVACSQCRGAFITTTHAPKPQKKFSDGPSLEMLRYALGNFSAEREWDQFHSPRNLALAMVGEVGELCEIFQWKGEVKAGLPGWTEEERTHLGEECADVLLYLVRLADKCGVDLPAAAQRKLMKNAGKYPAHLAKGSSKKYTAYGSLA